MDASRVRLMHVTFEHPEREDGTEKRTGFDKREMRHKTKSILSVFHQPKCSFNIPTETEQSFREGRFYKRDDLPVCCLWTTTIANRLACFSQSTIFGLHGNPFQPVSESLRGTRRVVHS